MVRRTLRALLLAVALHESVSRESSDTALDRRIADLRQQLKDDEGNLRHLEGNSRRLEEKTPSLYGDLPGTRAYTPLESYVGALDHMWLLLCACLVMLMQSGFAMVEAGCCRVKNVQSILLKNLTDVAMGTMGWWIFGWSFAYSELDENGFGGNTQFLGHHFLTVREDGQQEPTSAMINWFFQWAFCATAATIVSGGIAERVNFPGYSIFSFLMTAFIYPIIVAWSWGGGWLATMNTPGYMDFAGSGVVHLTGGIAALVGAAIAGPRRGRFEGLDTPAQKVMDMPAKFIPHSLPLITLGTFILWFGWYGFNCGSTLALHTYEQGAIAAMVAMNTTISASIAGLVVFAMRYAMMKKYDLGGMCCGVLAGLVSITAGCGNVESGSALTIGLIGGMIYQAASSALRVCKIDDPVDAFAVHGACGIWGVLAAGWFDMGRGSEFVHGWAAFKCVGFSETGACWSDNGGMKMGGNLYAAQFAEIFAIIAWSGGLSAIIFFALKMAKFLITADDIQEPGIDKSKHSPLKGYDVNAPPVTPVIEEDDQPLVSI